MSFISKYVVLAKGEELGANKKYDTFAEADAVAKERGANVMQLVYNFSLEDCEMVSRHQEEASTEATEYLANFRTYFPTRIGSAPGGAIFYEHPIHGDEGTVLAVYAGELWDTGDYEVPDTGDMHFWEPKVWKRRYRSA
jgi:hypothetical protein